MRVVTFLFTIFNASLKSILWGSDREILYEYGSGIIFCIKSEAQCFFNSQVKLANTGSETLNKVLISYKHFPQKFTMKIRLKNLNASKPRLQDPIFENQYMQDGNEIRLSKLAPGALVIIEFHGFIPIESRHILNDLGLEIIANASVIQSNPEATEFMRFFNNFL
ncbi:MAG: hypothetical protein Q9M92_09075 [Enterobacterales bacterium]|nr:hypothetical protein [Enterobacterales bacterium]